jgi:hypothetical protein
MKNKAVVLLRYQRHYDKGYDTAAALEPHLPAL